MTIALTVSEIALKNGRRIQVSAENWDISMRLLEMQRKAGEDRLPDSRMQLFSERLYPTLAAPAEGDVPTLEEAVKMLDDDPEGLDLWYRAVQRVNPDWFTYTGHGKAVKIEFSDGSKVTVSDGNAPAAIMRLAELEELARSNPDDNLSIQVFRTGFYPKMAACSSGQVPTEDEARKFPTAELNKWYNAAKQVNPHWFEALEQLSEEAKALAEADKLKKNKRRRRK